MTSFDRCLAVIYGHEGGWANHPDDPGGATSMGITRATLADWRGHPVSDDEVRALTRTEATAIYRARYWNPLRGDDLPAPIALMAFDAAVNCGVGRAAVWLQQAAGATPDGKIGPRTVQAVVYAVAQRGGAAVLSEMLALRIQHHASLPTWQTFGAGWSRRLAALPFQSMTMMQEGV